VVHRIGVSTKYRVSFIKFSKPDPVEIAYLVVLSLKNLKLANFSKSSLSSCIAGNGAKTGYFKLEQYLVIKHPLFIMHKDSKLPT
jgi:hypothetical protein